MDTGNFTGFNLTLDESGPSKGVAQIEFNTPDRLNGMTVGIKRDLIEAVTQAQMDNKVRVVVFTGQGRAFCAGDELGGYTKAIPGQEGVTPMMAEIPAGHDNALGTYNGLRTISQELNTRIRQLDKLTIAAINGVAIQTGFSLALACDFRIAASTARLGSATLRFGLLPDEGGQYLVVRALGLAKAMDFFMRKRILTAAQALELGLVNEVVTPDELAGATAALAAELAQGPQVAMRMLKRSLHNAAELPWNAALDEIAAKTAIVDHHPDAQEGVSAFKDKREPSFNAWLD